MRTVPIKRKPPSASTARPRKQRQPRLPHIDPEALAAAQGVQPVADPRELRADFWPEGESADDFVAALRRWRREGKCQPR